MITFQTASSTIGLIVDDSPHVRTDHLTFSYCFADGAYSEADAARLIFEIASALAFLHGVGVIHADLKPE